ncbi:MAG: ribonuclease P protein component [Alphaproteobacteria bacterium]
MHATKDQLANLHTLKKRSDFLHAQKSGVKWVSQGFILQIAENNLGQLRCGYTVTKKTEKSAVKRNRIKRRLRAVAADILPLHAKTSCDYVLIGRSQSLTRPYAALSQDLKWCLKKTGYLRDEKNKH